MRLSKLYSNDPHKFDPILFRTGLNVVLAEIRRPEDVKRDTHDLGKTTLGRLLDFCLLKKKTNDFFLFADKAFESFIFFLEVELFDGRYLTIRRSVETATKIALMLHDSPHHDFSEHPEESWTHWDVPFARAKTLVDGILDFRAISPFGFRDGVGQFLRLQGEFQEIFNRKFARGKDIDWKPFVARILGLNCEDIEKHYEIKTEIENKKKEQKSLASQSENIGIITGKIAFLQKEQVELQSERDKFDFNNEDRRRIEEAVREVGGEIDGTNKQLYFLEMTLQKIINSLQEEKHVLNSGQIEKIYKEAIGFFPEQIKTDYEKLVQFNRSITSERNEYLRKEKEKIQAEISKLNLRRRQLSEQQSSLLSFLKDANIFDKYKRLGDRLRDVEVQIGKLEYQKELASQGEVLAQKIKEIESKCETIARHIKADINSVQEDHSSLFSDVRNNFSAIIKKILDRKAIISISPNTENNVEFEASFFDDTDSKTQEDLGKTYRHLLCIAFDLAVATSHLSEQCPRVIFHDGVFEGQDVRKRELLREIYREYAAKGLQIVATTISSDLFPSDSEKGPKNDFFENDEVILRLHDDGESGRLFKMPTW